jgi:hypothetical protein
MTGNSSIAETATRPGVDEFAPFYAGYIARIPVGTDPIRELEAQLQTLPQNLSAVGEAGAGFRYAPGKWSIKEVIGHLTDAERIFGYRLLRIARADQTPLSGFDENEYVRAAGFDGRTLADLIGEWETVRRATIALVKNSEPGVWERRGTANGQTVSARALLFIIPGHVYHHLEVLRTRYGVGGAA